MDIGNQQRVIIVEEESVETPAPEPAVADKEPAEVVGEWPLPLALEPEPARAN